ncbi:hypothetical protein QE412_001529 [Microbacterium trichothecenolyticum]|uniref:Uncharacterized protein n=1 Tax=Microbacterium trichothecenolyticum TaxID=69370 RepID=A0ABU0TTH3_MICTR|nr:hypothetical protein [Microbacterium trichothecenolyticum]
MSEVGCGPAGDVARYYPGHLPLSAGALSGSGATVRYDGVSKKMQTETGLHG